MCKSFFFFFFFVIVTDDGCTAAIDGGISPTVGCLTNTFSYELSNIIKFAKKY